LFFIIKLIYLSVENSCILSTHLAFGLPRCLLFGFLQDKAKYVRIIARPHKMSKITSTSLRFTQKGNQTGSFWYILRWNANVMSLCPYTCFASENTEQITTKFSAGVLDQTLPRKLSLSKMTHILYKFQIEFQKCS